MLTLHQRISAFSELGLIMAEAASDSPSSTEAISLRSLMDMEEQSNKWFTPDNVKLAVRSIAEMLDKKKLIKWLNNYVIEDRTEKNKTIAVIMAGNIPLVGFHDLLCVLISGNSIMARTSSKDSRLIKQLSAIIKKVSPELGKEIVFTEKIRSDYDAVIATGSDNTSRYFEYYFGNKPHIFRKNRNSVAIIDTNTKKENIVSLARDIFAYFGLGCRNVSKIYIENGIDIAYFSENWKKWADIIKHKPYANNYLYNKSLLNINKSEYHDSGFFLLVQNDELSSPVSVVNYNYFNDTDSLIDELNKISNKIQCIVSDNNVRFGQTQFPEPWEYADNMDTLEFLLSL